MEFRGDLRWLSNFWPAEVALAGVTYPSVEHAYQAAKTLDPAEREWVREAKTPGQAKRRGRKVTLRPDWTPVFKRAVMLGLLRQKFARGSTLETLLLGTGNQKLVEGNTWHDNFWGSCQCTRCGDKGQNHLGKLLMQVRAERR